MLIMLSGLSDTEREKFIARERKIYRKRLREISPTKAERDYAAALAGTDYKCRKCAFYHRSLNSENSCKMPYSNEYVECVKINPCVEGILTELCTEPTKTQIFDDRWLDVFGEPEDKMPRLMYECFGTIRTLAELITTDAENGGVISEKSLEYAQNTYQLMRETIEDLDRIIAEE